MANPSGFAGKLHLGSAQTEMLSSQIVCLSSGFRAGHQCQILLHTSLLNLLN